MDVHWKNRNEGGHRGEGRGQETVKVPPPGGQKGTLTDEGGGKIEFAQSGGGTIKIDTQGISINAPGGKVTIQAASQVEVTASQVNVNAAMSKFSGIVKCDVLQATTVISSTYTPGAGNIW